MRIAINLTAVRADVAGPMNYCEGFLPAFLQLTSDDDVLIFVTPEVYRKLGGLPFRNATVELVEVRGRAWIRVLWEQFVLPFRLARWRTSVLFAAFDLVPLLSPCTMVLGVRNPSPARTGTLWDIRGRVHRILAGCSGRRAKFVFYPTEFASTLLGDGLGVPIGKRRVIPHGTDKEIWRKDKDNDARNLRVYDLSPGKFLLFVSNFYPYKQPELVVTAFARWRTAFGHSDFKLALVGKGPGEFDKQEAQLRRIVDNLRLSKDVVFAINIPRTHLPALYRNAAAFILPTLMETFCHPFVEAMACGVPIICEEKEFAREICGDAAFYLRGANDISIAEAIQNIVTDGSLCSRMRESGFARAASYSWEREARETLALLREAVDEQGQEEPIS